MNYNQLEFIGYLPVYIDILVNSFEKERLNPYTWMILGY